MAGVDVVFAAGERVAVEHSTASDLAKLLSEPSDGRFLGRYLHAEKAHHSGHVWLNPDTVAYVEESSTD